MLILSRCKGETIFIGDHITVTITDVDGKGRVRLGIEAPQDVAVDREEIRFRKLACRSSVLQDAGTAIEANEL